MTRSTRVRPGLIGIYLPAAALVVVSLFPYAYAVEESLRPLTELFTPGGWRPASQYTLNNYRDVFDTDFVYYFRNSAIVGVSTALVSLLIGAPAGYALARARFHGRNTIATGVLLVYMIPSVLLLVPMYVLFARIGLAGTLLSLVIVYTTFAVPFSVWMTRSFFLSIPIELEEAARIDGCNLFKMLTRVVLPLATPGLVTAAIYSFVLAWNELLFGYTFISDETSKTLTIGIASAFGEFQNQWNLLLPETVLAGVPTLAFFYFLGKYMTQGLISGGVKG